MIPTIDISLIGVLLTIWNVFLTIWRFLTQALNWITQRALALYLGSRLWATLFFITGLFALLTLFDRVLGSILGFIADVVTSSATFTPFAEPIKLIGKVIPMGVIADCVTYLGSAISIYFLSTNYCFWWHKIFGIFKQMSRGFK